MPKTTRPRDSADAFFPNGRRVPRGYRPLVVRGRTWRWRFGRTINIISPEGTSTPVALTEMTGRSWDEIERADWKGYTKAVTSRTIRDHIDRSILGYTDADGFPTGSPERGRTETVGPDWTPARGPRGTWHWRDGPCDIVVMSPEGVQTSRRGYLVVGVGVDEWIAAKHAALEAKGLAMRDIDAQNRLDTLLHQEVAIGHPTTAQVEAMIVEITTA